MSSDLLCAYKRRDSPTQAYGCNFCMSLSRRPMSICAVPGAVSRRTNYTKSRRRESPIPDSRHRNNPRKMYCGINSKLTLTLVSFTSC